MKALLIVFSVLIGTISYAQVEAIEITPTFGYTFNGSITQYDQFYDLKDAVSFGGIVNVEVRSKKHIEVSYRRSIQTVQYVETFSSGQFEAGMEQFHIGIFQELGDNSSVKPFFNVAFGATRYFEEQKRWLDAYRYSLAMGVGAKFFITDNFGIRVQSQLVMPLSYNSVGVFCDGSGYCSGGASFNVPIVHFDLSTGLILRISTN